MNHWLNFRPNSRRTLSTALAACGLVFNGCAVVEELDRDEPELRPVWETLPSLPEAQTPPAGEPGTAVAPVEAVPELYDIDVQNAPAQVFFMGLVKDTDYNMVVHPDVDGTISLTLRDVTIPEVMQVTQRVFG